MRLLLALFACLALAGCSSGEDGDAGTAGSDRPPAERKPVIGQSGDDDEAPADLGFPAYATKNTTRVGGADPVADAAGSALATYPATERALRPQAVTLVDQDDWQAAISAAQLLADPIGAPVLFTDGDELPAASEAALERLAPTGAARAGKAQVIRVGTAARPDGFEDTNLEGGDPAALARAIDALHAQAAGDHSGAVVVASQDEPAYAMPAAAWAARSGDPVLWVRRETVPAETRRAIQAHGRPRIYILGPESVIAESVETRLAGLGEVRRIDAPDPVRSAIAFARFSDGRFGWNVTDPGHGVLFASQKRPADAAAAAPMATSGKYGPLLVIPEPDALPGAIREYLLDIQPGYDRDPVRGVYNHGWLMGDESAISLEVQARIDALLEIQPVRIPDDDRE